MNRGKRYIRNSVLTLYGATALFIGLNRLYASTVDAQTAPWLRNTLALGLHAESSSESTELPPVDLATLHDFTRVHISGEFDVQIVGAAQYKVTFTPPAGSDLKLRARQQEGRLSLDADEDDETAKGVVRIEMPNLERLSLQDAQRLTVTGLQSQQVELSLHHVAAAALQRNAVARWKVYSNEPLELQVDQATLVAGSVRTQGELSIRYGEVATP